MSIAISKSASTSEIIISNATRPGLSMFLWLKILVIIKPKPIKNAGILKKKLKAIPIIPIPKYELGVFPE